MYIINVYAFSPINLSTLKFILETQILESKNGRKVPFAPAITGRNPTY